MSKRANPMKYFSGNAFARLPLYKLLAGGMAGVLCAGLGIGVMAASFTAPQATPETAAPAATPLPTVAPKIYEAEPETPTPAIEAEVSVIQQDVGVMLYKLVYPTLPIFTDPEQEDAYVLHAERGPLLGVETTVTLTDSEGNATDFPLDPETGTALAEDMKPGDYTLTVQPIEGYTLPDAQTVTVKEKVVYKADVAAVKDKIVQASQVNEKKEDSGASSGGSAPIAEEVTDTVAYAESSRESVGSSGKTYTAKLSDSGHLLLSDGTVTNYLPVYDETTKALTGAIRDPSRSMASGVSASFESMVYDLGSAAPADARVYLLEGESEAAAVNEVPAENTPEPIADATPEPTAEPTPEPTPEPTAEPTPEPTPEPTAEPTPEPTPAPTAEPTAEAGKQAEVMGPVRRSMAPDFTCYDDAGNAVALSDMRGKPVVVNFFASWCGPCKMEMPYFDECYAKYGDRVTFMMVNLCAFGNDTKENGKQMVESGGWTFPVYFDTDGEAATTYAIRAMPTTIFVSAEGELKGRHTGMMDRETLEKTVRAMIGEDLSE